MNFIEAVEAMKEGKVTRCLLWEDESTARIDFETNIILVNGHKVYFHQDWVLSEWEVVDDEGDWNLADQKTDMYKFCNADVVKCRDLILQDLQKVYLNFDDESAREDIELVIKSRFGDLNEH